MVVIFIQVLKVVTRIQVITKTAKSMEDLLNQWVKAGDVHTLTTLMEHFKSMFMLIYMEKPIILTERNHF